MAKAVTSDETLTEQDCPDEDTPFSAMLFGKMVGAARLSASDMSAIKMFVEIAYEDTVTFYNKGLNMAKSEIAGAETKSGAHGGKMPNESEEKKILSEKGMPWQEVVAVSSVLYSGTVPTAVEIAMEGYGSDPGQWQSAKELRKSGKPNMNHFLKNRDAAGYRAMVTKGATRMAATGLYATGAAMLMLFVQKLSKMTFDQGMPELFLDYCEEHVEMHKGQGLASSENPIDQAILTETVLAEKSKAQAYDEKIDKMMSSIETANAAIDQKMRGRMGEVSALVSKVAALEKALGEKAGGGGRGGGGPPSADNPCSYCGATDHFVRDCPKRKEADERKATRRAEETAAAASSSATNQS